jgi:hypothetical protein
MVGGFNTNVRYRGRIFHVQTEDSGPGHPHIVTLLYEAGAILYSKKTSYADRKRGADLEAVVRDLMEEQHREMVRRLKAGALDDVVGLSAPPKKSAGERAAAPEATEFGQGVITSRPLDEVVLAHLSAV